MRKIYFIIPFILVLSCAKPPEPRTANPENAPLETPEEFGRIGLSPKLRYDPTSIIFNFFFWPSNLNREILKDLSTEVSMIGIGIEKEFKNMDANNKYIEVDSIIEKENLEKEKEIKVLELYKKYGCTKSETGDSCTDGETSELVIPGSCEDLGGPPWNRIDLKDKCTNDIMAIETEYIKKSNDIGQKISDKESENDEILENMAKGAEDLSNLLENNNTNENEWVNWMRTESGGAKIEFKSGESLPQITLEIIFNNNLQNVDNRKLKYKSRNPEEITGLHYYVENQIPVLEFKMFEKRATGPRTEEKTGVFYTLKLRQTELDFGLEFLGEVERFDASGKSFGKGIMKLYFPRRY